jgi:hypothetical protein
LPHSGHGGRRFAADERGVHRIICIFIGIGLMGSAWNTSHPKSKT